MCSVDLGFLFDTHLFCYCAASFESPCIMNNDFCLVRFQGRLNDVNKEFRVARDQGKFVVSPYWLMAVSFVLSSVTH
jgi:hypothetical protein